jgi:hypothetical protein
VTVRSWLFKTLNWFSSDAFDDDCDSAVNGLCAYKETTTGADTVEQNSSASLWAWEGDCNYGSGPEKLCPIQGLNGDSTAEPATTGLTQAATAVLGTLRDGSDAPTLLYKDYEDNDYTYDNVTADIGAGSVTTNALAVALYTYEKWQKSFLMSEMMKTACWTLAAATDADDATNDFVSGDEKSTWCHFNNADQTGTQHFHPLI